MKKQIVTLCVGMIALATIAGCKWWGSSDDKAQKPTVRVVNVLSRDLYDDAHIKDSISVDFSNLEAAAANWNKEVPVVVYCSNYACRASAMAATMLKKLGFTKVMAYEGGMAEWYQLHKEDASYEIEGPGKQEYLTVVVKKPADAHTDIEVVTAQQLKDMLKPVKVACTNPMGCCPATTH